VGDCIAISDGNDVVIEGETVSFQSGLALTMAFNSLAGVRPGMTIKLKAARSTDLAVSHHWIGRIVDPLGRAIDGCGILVNGSSPRIAKSSPPPAIARARLGRRYEFGIKALDCFAATQEGQRLGLFAGSGVGKSTLISMLARNSSADVIVIALVGERGREVREFVEGHLGPEGLARSVVVVATSDCSPLMRRQAAYAAVTIAEYFRDLGKSVLLLMDSLTRFCHSQREIALSVREFPASKG
jgi:flagellum-specific ATP synthase